MKNRVVDQTLFRDGFYEIYNRHRHTGRIEKNKRVYLCGNLKQKTDNKYIPRECEIYKK